MAISINQNVGIASDYCLCFAVFPCYIIQGQAVFFDVFNVFVYAMLGGFGLFVPGFS